MQHPWNTGDLETDWQGYFIPGTDVLRNRVGADAIEALSDAENDLVEARIIELRESPGLLGDRTYDLTFLQAIHRQLFKMCTSGPATCALWVQRRATSRSARQAIFIRRWIMSRSRYTNVHSSRR